MRSQVKRVLRFFGYEIKKLRGPDPGIYDEDGLTSRHYHDFLSDPRFLKAYTRGQKAAGKDYHFRWRVYVATWAAEMALKLPGDFVECGVNRGFMSSAIMEYLDWNSVQKKFYLLDTFKGFDDRLISEKENKSDLMKYYRERLDSDFYVMDLEPVKQNFNEWRNIILVQGTIPETLSKVDCRQIAFLHLDTECLLPDIATLDSLWDRITPGGIILMNDYAYSSYRAYKSGMDEYIAKFNVRILTLPTGQGFLIKPG